MIGLNRLNFGVTDCIVDHGVFLGFFFFSFFPFSVIFLILLLMPWDLRAIISYS